MPIVKRLSQKSPVSQLSSLVVEKEFSTGSTKILFS